MKTTKSLMCLMLTGTVCAVILCFIVASMFYPPGAIAETSRQEVWKLLTFILGIVSGYLGKSADDAATKPPEVKPPEVKPTEPPKP